MRMTLMQQVSQSTPPKSSKFSVNLGNQGPFILMIVVIYFVFFGLIANSYERNIDEQLIWVYHTFFSVSLEINSNLVIPLYGAPILILFLVCLFLTYNEDIYHYGIRKSIWLVPIINFISIVFHWMIYGFSLRPLQLLFGHYQGYLTMVILLAINLSGAICGWKLKDYVIKRKNRLE